MSGSVGRSANLAVVVVLVVVVVAIVVAVVAVVVVLFAVGTCPVVDTGDLQLDSWIDRFKLLHVYAGSSILYPPKRG